MRTLTWFKITQLPAYTYWLAAERSGFATYGIPDTPTAPRTGYYWSARVAGKLYEGVEDTIEASKDAAENAFRKAEAALGWENV